MEATKLKSQISNLKSQISKRERSRRANRSCCAILTGNAGQIQTARGLKRQSPPGEGEVGCEPLPPWRLGRSLALPNASMPLAQGIRGENCGPEAADLAVGGRSVEEQRGRVVRDGARVDPGHVTSRLTESNKERRRRIREERKRIRELAGTGGAVPVG